VRIIYIDGSHIEHKRGESFMNYSVKKLLIGAALSTVIFTGTTGITFAAMKTTPLSTMIEQTTLEKQQMKLKQVLKFAKQGKVINSAYGLGTKPQTILNTWGQPEDKAINYLDYQKRQVLYFSKNSIKQPVSFIQSTDKSVTTIRYNTIKETLGKALNDREYKGTHELTYKVGEYHVSFVFPSLYSDLTNEPSNPKVFSYSIDKTPITTAEKQAAKLILIMKYAKQGNYLINDSSIEAIRLKTVKTTLGKPLKEIEYKGAHLVTYKSGKYNVTFEFPSIYNDSSDQSSNPKIISYSVYK